MKCENCGTDLSTDAKICHECGNKIEKNNIDNMLKDMVVSKKQKKIKKRQPKIDNNLKLDIVSKVMGYIGAVVMIFIVITLFLNWFEISGKAVNKGLIEQNEQIVENISVSPVKLLEFVKKYEKEYSVVATKELTQSKEKSIPSIINIIYIKGFYIVFIMVIISGIVFLFDKKLKFVFLNRIMNILSALVVAVNYMAVKIPFFNMIVLRARNILQYENIKYPVFININGISVNEMFYPYRLVEKNGFFIAVTLIVFWFVITTILIEIRKEQEKAKKMLEKQKI